MALTFIETRNSREFEVTARGATETLRFTAFRSYDQNEVFGEALLNTSPIFDNLIRGKVGGKHLGGGVWEVEVPYGLPEGGAAADGGGTPVGITPVIPVAGPGINDPLDPSLQGMTINFDVGTETQHITQSFNTRHLVKRGGGPARDFKRAIGVSKRGVEGVDVFRPTFEFQVTITRPTLSIAYMQALREAMAKVNDAPWWNFEAFEVLYLGATGQNVERGKWSVTHRFAARENFEEEEITDGLTLPIRRAWDYVWYTYEEEDATEGQLTLPEEAYVEEVYRTTDFSLLGLGV